MQCEGVVPTVVGIGKTAGKGTGFKIDICGVQHFPNLQTVSNILSLFVKDWEECERILDKLVAEGKRGEASASQAQTAEDSNKIVDRPPDEDEEDSRLSLDLGGFTPTEIFNIVNQVKRRIAGDRAVYKQRVKKVYAGIGAKLDQIGTSEGRLTVRRRESDFSVVAPRK